MDIGLMITKEEVLDKLREVMDPELGINIVDMGFIYDIKIEKNKVHIKMTCTTPACPLLSFIKRDVENKLEQIKNADFEVEFVFEPKWTPERMSKKAKEKLGIK